MELGDPSGSGVLGGSYWLWGQQKGTCCQQPSKAAGSEQPLWGRAPSPGMPQSPVGTQQDNGGDPASHHSPGARFHPERAPHKPWSKQEGWGLPRIHHLQTGISASGFNSAEAESRRGLLLAVTPTPFTSRWVQPTAGCLGLL